MTGFSLETFLPYQLNRAAEQTSLEFQRVYRQEYGMLRTEWRVLFHLGHYGPMAAREICDRGGLHKTKVSRAVAALETKRFLKRKRMEDDRRHETLSLTPTGERAFARLTEKARDYQTAITAKFTTQELEILTRCLRALAKI